VAKFDDEYNMRIFTFKETQRNTALVEPPNLMAMTNTIGRYHALTLGTDVENFHGHADKGASAVRWSPDGKLLVSGGDDGSVRIWDLNGVERAALQLERQNSTMPMVQAVAWCPIGQGKGDVIAIGASDGRLLFWNVESALSNTLEQGELKIKIANKTKAFDEFAHALLDKCNLASVEEQKELDALFVDKKKEFDREKSELELKKAQVESQSKASPTVVSFTGHQGASPATVGVTSLAYNVEGYLASGSRDGSVKIWDLRADLSDAREEGPLVATITEHTGMVHCVSWHGSTLATAASDGTVRFFNKDGSPEPGSIITAPDDGSIRKGFTSVAICPSDSSPDLVATGSADSTVRVWDRNTGEVVFSSSMLRNCKHADAVGCVTWADAEHLVTCSSDKTLRVWCIKHAMELLGQYTSILSVLDKPEFNLPEMALEKECYTKSIIDMTLEINPMVLNGFERGVVDVAVSPDGNTIAAASIDKNSPVGTWNLPEVLALAKAAALAKAEAALHEM